MFYLRNFAYVYILMRYLNIVCTFHFWMKIEKNNATRLPNFIYVSVLLLWFSRSFRSNFQFLLFWEWVNFDLMKKLNGWFVVMKRNLYWNFGCYLVSDVAESMKLTGETTIQIFGLLSLINSSDCDCFHQMFEVNLIEDWTENRFKMDFFFFRWTGECFKLRSVKFDRLASVCPKTVELH